MPDPSAIETKLPDLASRHGVSVGAVHAVLDALKRGGGSMAQFSHDEFGGMSQWSRGMTMVGDMFNTGLRDKLNAVATELADLLAAQPVDAAARSPQSSYTSSGTSSSVWWPENLGTPHSTGGQNAMRYAIFDGHVVIDDHGSIAAYDTGGRKISGIAQAQSGSSTLTFTGPDGVIALSDLRKVS